MSVNICPHGQAVKTSPSHGGIWGSIPHGGTKKKQVLWGLFFLSVVYNGMLSTLALYVIAKGVFSPMSHCTLCVRNFVARTPEHWADASLCEQTHSFRYYARFTCYESVVSTKKNLVRKDEIFLSKPKDWYVINAEHCM